MSKKDDEELIGFQDFIRGGKDPFLKTDLPKKRKNVDFELETFLEQESVRISKHIEVLEEKVYVIKKYSQYPSLLIQAESENNHIRTKTIELCSREDSPLFRNLNEIFSNFFKL